MISGSLLFLGGYSIYSLFAFTSKDIKTIYQKRVFQDEYATPGWICPKCSNKMVFSIACWNCGFKKEDLNKPTQVLKSEDDKLDSYLHKKNEIHHA
jgi:DNA-directed RNA polymerase subunit RPC12/RpoP